MIKTEKTLCEYLMEQMPGFKIRDIDGALWVRVEDSISNHLEGYFVNVKTGEITHASRLPELFTIVQEPLHDANGQCFKSKERT